MEKLIGNAKDELCKIETEGLTLNNLDQAYKLASIYHHLSEEEEKANGGQEMMREYGSYGRGGRGRVDYRYMTDRPYDDYSYGRRGGYRGNDRFREHLNRVIDGADMYEYGRERYMEGGSEERIYDGLEKLMYAVCTFVESTMDFAESAEEKEIIRKHIQKLKNI